MPAPTRPSAVPGDSGHPNTPTSPGEPVTAGAAPQTERDVAAAATVGYRHAGSLTAEQVINGDADKYAWLDPKILEVTAWVQQSLVTDNRGEDIEKSRTDPVLRQEIAEEIDRLALQYLLRQRGIRGEEGQILIATVVNDIVGLGPIEPLWQDPTITEVIVNGPTDVYVERNGKLMKAQACRFRSQEHLLDVCQRILAPLNRKVDVRDPLADGRLPDGSRVNVVHQALAPKGPLLTIRRFPESNRSLIDLTEIGSISPEMATLVAGLVRDRASCLVVGGTGSGKALDVDTPIATPHGFVAMGDLTVGDTVFDETGAPTVVTGAYDVMYDHDCFEVVFEDGSSLIADAEHLWFTHFYGAKGREPGVRDTRSIAETLTTSAGEPAHFVPVTRPLQVSVPVGATPAGWGESERQERLSELLREAGMPHPGTDSGLPDFGAVDISFLDAESRREVAVLACSLGYQVHRDPATRDATTVQIRPRAGIPETRAITEVRPAPSRPVRCIRVNTPSHLFLAGYDLIPTHNTTLLNALSAAIPTRERVVTIEDSLELRLNPTSHVAAMEARPPDSTGGNAVTIRQLVKNALRMRPDRIVVGEIRDSAALDMLQACNTGHEGSMSTVHANGPNEAISRVTVMVAQGGEIPADKVEWLIGSAIDIIVMVRRYEDGSRRVSGIYEVPDINSLNEGEPLRTIPLWEWEQTGTNDDGMLEGHYVERNHISDALRKARGIDLHEPVTWEDLQRMCGVEVADTTTVKPTRPLPAGGD